MTNEQMNRACAEWLEYTELQMQNVPNFCNDRNVLPELIENLSFDEQQQQRYLSFLAYAHCVLEEPTATQYFPHEVCHILCLPMRDHVQAILWAIGEWVE